MKILTYNRNSNLGFTLIEIIVVIGIMAVIAGVTVTNFNNYLHAQTLQETSFDLITMLHIAKSDAQSQVKPQVCAAQQLNGFKVKIQSASTPQSYELDVECNGVDTLIQTKSLPTNVSYDTAPAQTTSYSFFFPVLSTQIPSPGKVTMTGFGNKKVVNVDAIGNITLQ